MADNPKRSKKWIKGATSGAHGQFAAKAKKSGETTREFASENAGDAGKTGKQARLAENLMSMNHKGARDRYSAKTVRKA
jgi:hypothetical protein